MTTFARVAIAVIGMMGLAAAQAKADPKPDAKASGMPEVKPPPELAEAARAIGTWKCKGQGMDHTMKMNDLAGTLKITMDLDGWWIHSSFGSNMGKEPYHFESFSTFDVATKKWKRVMVESGGAWAAGESAGMTASKGDWDLTMHTAMGDAMFRDHEDVSDMKTGAKMWGEFSPDSGKSWVKVYNMVCTK